MWQARFLNATGLGFQEPGLPHLNRWCGRERANDARSSHRIDQIADHRVSCNRKVNRSIKAERRQSPREGNLTWHAALDDDPILLSSISKRRRPRDNYAAASAAGRGERPASSWRHDSSTTSPLIVARAGGTGVRPPLSMSLCHDAIAVIVTRLPPSLSTSSSSALSAAPAACSVMSVPRHGTPRAWHASIHLRRDDTRTRVVVRKQTTCTRTRPRRACRERPPAPREQPGRPFVGARGGGNNTRVR